MRNFPIDWVLTELENLGQILTGKTPSTKDEANFNGAIPFIKPGDLDNGGYIYKTADTLTKEGLKSVPSLPKNSIMVTCIGNLGKVGITSQLSATNQQINSIIPSTSIDHKFLYHQLCTLKPWLESESSATTVSIINKGKFSKAPVLIAPIAEQKVIAEKLDDMLAKVERIKARLERITRILKQFRQSVLADAVSGKLTEDWRKSDDYNLLNETLAYPINWTASTLGAALNYGKCSKRDSARIDLNEWVLELEDIEKDSSRLLDKLTLEKRQSKSTKNEFKKGDVLYGKLRPYLNKVIIADQDGLCTTEIIPISPTENLLSFYIFIWLKSPFFMEYVNRITYGVNMPRLGTDDGKEAPIVIPPITEQKEIARLVTNLFDYADKVEKQTLSALEKINSLTQSILSKAFKGELTEQWRKENPELISDENSAKALLAKIKAETKKK